MSMYGAQNFPVVQYIHVSDLFQEIQRETPDSLPLTLRIAPIDVTTGRGSIWGVLLTTFSAATIHAAWIAVEAASALKLTPYRTEQAKAKQQRLSIRLMDYASRQPWVAVRPGFYVVPEAVFRFSAILPKDLFASGGEGGSSWLSNRPL